MPFRLFGSKKKRACYVGFIGKGNLGDEALLRAIRETFQDTFQFSLTDAFAKLPGFLKEKGPFDALFLGGGTLIKPNKTLAPLKQALVENPQTRFIVYGTGVGDADMWADFGRETDKAGWCDILERSAYLSVRGPLSKKHLASWGFSKPIPVVGDPALYFARPAYQPKSGAMRIGINLGPAGGFVLGKDENAILRFGAELMTALAHDGWQITLFPVIKTDVDYLHEAARLAGIKNYHFHNRYEDLDYTLHQMERQDVLVGEKLHSVVLAHCVYTPSVMLAYRTKCVDYMLSVGAEKFTYTTDQLALEPILESIRMLTEQSELAQAQLFERIQNWKRALAEAALQVKSLFTSE